MIIIPMAGLSERFFRAGYAVPKFKLPLGGCSVFAHAVGSFSRYFDSEHFVFVVRSDYDTEHFVREQLENLQVRHFEVHVLASPTRGQAETAQLGIERSGRHSEPVTIFNIDTFRRDYQYPTFTSTCDGFLEVFVGEGDHWSFIEPIDDQRVSRTTEKERISDYCSDGLYYFRSGDIFSRAYAEAKQRQLYTRGEIYIAPLYNLLIRDGLDVRYQLTDIGKIGFCGTPGEYAAMLAAQGD